MENTGSPKRSDSSATSRNASSRARKSGCPSAVVSSNPTLVLLKEMPARYRPTRGSAISLRTSELETADMNNGYEDTATTSRREPTVSARSSRG
jgi:hypothetical protein